MAMDNGAATCSEAGGLSAIQLQEQVDENLRYAAAASFAGVFNALIALVVFWSAALALPLVLWGVLVLIGSGIRLLVIRLGDDKTREKKRWIEGIALYNGIVWGAGVAAGAALASPAQYVVVVILCSGMMGASVTTYTSMARAAMLFVIPVGIGGLMALMIHPIAPTVPGIALLGCYMILLASGAKRRQSRFLERIWARDHLARSSATVKLLLNDYESQSSDWLWQVDSAGIILNPSERFREVSGIDEDMPGHMSFLDLFDESRGRDILKDHIHGQHPFRDLTLRLTIRDEPHWWTLSAQRDDQGGMRGVAADVTAQKRAEERVRYMAHYDELTELANRFLFNETLQRHLSKMAEYPAGEAANHAPDNQLAVLCLDLDGFKSVNDTLGHPTGDRLLAVVAQRILGSVRNQDMVARLGGDEFAVLILGNKAAERAEYIAGRILETVSQPFDLDGAQVATSVSIGIASWNPAHGAEKLHGPVNAATMMKQADLALYAAKEGGRNRFARFERQMDIAARERRDLEMDLRNALQNGEFELHFQPLINIETGQTTSFEALVRWNHPERGIVMPDDFIGIAEDTGLITELGEWIIRHACHLASNWPSHMRVSVNLSPVQMRSTGLVATIFSAIANAGLDPSRLELEITENVLLHDSEANIAILHQLHEFGVRIALDDFGTGYSSLNYLRSFPFDKIKIDRCFVTDLADSEDCKAIVRAVTELAGSLGMTTTAEGVELESQLEELKVQGCTEAQGFLFSRPERPDQFTDLRGTGLDAASDGEPANLAILKLASTKPDTADDTEGARGPAIRSA
ncbi:Cyclic di-GMP phosphodiesterase Gmr [Alteripontixanthobacter maritimus]|uniref:Cyclic di-GMP phosphodiesterase Gmr n=1 Tax=Alteripontixanthobacter maritimus TaxID=2161824 RepID=A0A369Q8A5_9SPHN|nr:EAL domain-containing protein [Alteripontixanthobacter maritimus]RDC60702.1 Cyclic di-GMP phosphodiesterase Gmr [Alteripontixanthobacter maritimus]